MARNRSSQPRSERGTDVRMPPASHRFRPLLMELEDRNLLSVATFTVTNTLDDGSTGSLRWAVEQANATSGASLIEFDPTAFATAQTITLDGTQLELSNTTGSETIEGPAAGVTISAGGLSRVLQIDSGVTASISGLTFTDGFVTGDGAGILNLGYLTLTYCTVSGSSSGDAGGGIGSEYRTQLSLIDCTLSGNRTTHGGGGLQTGVSVTETLYDCTISGNQGGEGGGLDGNNAAVLTNCTISGNTSANYGGGIDLYNSPGWTLINCTVSGNEGPFGGLRSHTTSGAPSYFTLVNTIVAGNTGNIDGSTGTDNVLPANISAQSTNNLIGGNALLAPLGNYGGPTDTMPLLPGSTAIGAGTSVGAPTTDQRGEPIGAFQSQGFQIAVKSGGSQVAVGLDSPFALPLTVTVAANNPLEPVDGGVVTFAANPPGSVTLSSASATISGGSASVAAESTDAYGTVIVTASATGCKPGAVPFNLVIPIDVTNLTDVAVANEIDFRQAVALGTSAIGTATIVLDTALFATPQTLLLSGPLVFESTTIPTKITDTGPALVISGGGQSQVIKIGSGVTVSLTNMTISDGWTAGPGGGIENQGTLVLNECTVSGSTAQNGGGIDNASGASATLTDCTLSGNAATENGGAVDNQGGTLTATNSTFSGNSAGASGGAIFNDATAAATLANCTISGNSAANDGGGAYNAAGGVFSLGNSIIAGNTATVSGPDVCGVFTSLGTNLIGETDGSSGWLSSDLTGTITQPLDPKLGPLQNNGGSTETLALLAGSPAIDAGSNSIEGLVIPTTDERGALRGSAGLNAGSSVDIGAYEASSSYLVTAALDSYAVGTLRSAVGWANVNVNNNSANLESPAANTIKFDEANAFSTPQVITLDPNLGTIVLSGTTTPIAIADPPAGLVTISGGEMVGVFMVTAGVTAMISGVTISGGSTKGNGGGIDDEGGYLTLDNVVLAANKASGSGGGVFITKRGTTTIIGCSVVGNSASSGGGVYGEGNSLIMNESTLSGNTAVSEGGGVFVSEQSTSIFINSTLVGNAAAGGGGVYNASANATLEFCTITGNTAIIGGGIDNSGDGARALEDTLVAGNMSSGGMASDIGGSNGAGVTGSYNLIGSGGSGGLSNGVDGNIVGVSNPGLGQLGNYGGSNETIPLLPGSPGIGTGDPIPGIGSDERGIPIEPGNPVDIGAFQSYGFTIVVTASSTPQSEGTGDAFHNPLTITAIPNDPFLPFAGGVIDFTATTAAGGASAILSSGTAVIGSDGTAQVNAVANSFVGSYTVIASADGAINSGVFQLTNLPTPTFSITSSPSIVYGTTSVLITGTLAYGTEYPVAGDVTITLNGTTSTAVIGAQGAFSSSFDLNGTDPAGTVYPLTFAYATDGTFGSAHATGSVTITQNTPTITWPNPLGITYGTPLSTHQLDATESAIVGGVVEQIAGTLVYAQPLGTVLGAGDQELSVTFTPTDMTDFATVTGATTIDVAKATPIVAWADSTIYLGTPLSATELDATSSWTVDGQVASVPGVYNYTPGFGTVLPVGPGQPLSVSFQPADAIDYNTATAEVHVNVVPAVNLAITQFTSNESTVQVGDTITYTLVVTNTGPSVATGVSLDVAFRDLNEPNVTAVTLTPVEDPAGVVRSLGTIPVGGSATVVFSATPNTVGDLVAMPQVMADQFDEGQGVNVGSPVVRVLGRVGTIQFSESAYLVPGNAGIAAITVTRINGTSGVVTLDYSTISINATPGLDYTPVSGTLTFPDGVASETIFVPVLSDPYASRDEVIQVILTNIQNSEGFITPAADSSATATLSIAPTNPDTAPLAVTAVNLGATSRGIDEIDITFNKPLDPATANDSRNYTLTSLVNGGGLSRAQIAMSQVLYSPGSLHVTLLLSQPLPMNQFFLLSLNAGATTSLRDRDGQMLTTNGTAGATMYSDLIGMGTKLTYITASGQQVDLKLTGGGLLEDVITSSGVGITLTIAGEAPDHTVLWGTVKKARGTSDRVYLANTVRGLGNFGDVRVKLNPAQFQVGSYPFSPGSPVSNVAGPMVGDMAVTKPSVHKALAKIGRGMGRLFHAVRHCT